MAVRQCRRISPLAVAVDAHPAIARLVGGVTSLPVEPVLHHHAHAAACPRNTAGRSTAAMIALTLDGIGMGKRRAVGGECLRVSYRERILAASRPSRCRAAIWRRASRINLLAQCPFIPDWQSYPQTAALGHETGRCWRRPSNAALIRRAPPADGCLPSPARWAGLRRNPSQARLPTAEAPAIVRASAIRHAALSAANHEATFWQQGCAAATPEQKARAFMMRWPGGLAARDRASRGSRRSPSGGVLHNQLLAARLSITLQR